MTAGVNVHGFRGYPTTCSGLQCPGIPTLIQTLNGTAPANNVAIEVVKTPGTNWVYSGGGYEVFESFFRDYMGANAYDAYVEDKIINYLALKHSTLWRLPPYSVSMSTENAWGFIGPQKAAPTQWNTYPELTAAGFWTTPSDMAQLLLEISAAFNGQRTKILTQKSAQAMMTPVDGAQYGLGGAARNVGTPSLVYMKNGSNLGFSGWFVLYPGSGDGIVIFSNYDFGEQTPQNWSTLFASIASTAANSLSWSNFPGLADSG